MKKLVLLVAVFLFAGFLTLKISNRTLELESADREISHQEDLVLYRGQLFSGRILERYPNGDLFRETSYLDGYKEGPAAEYGLGQKRRLSWNFHNNQKDGLQQGWYLEGPKRFEFNYKNGILDGIQTEWHMNGNLFRRQSFAGGFEADKKILYQFGEVFSNYSKRDNRIYGIDGGALCFEPPREGEKL